ncbi:hypothetical protein AEMCBJ_32185 (plasmid) [Cupriavidus necator]
MIGWLDRQEPASFAITAVTVAGLMTGIARLPDVRRKAGLQEACLAEAR